VNVPLDPRDQKELEALAGETGKDAGKLIAELVHEALASRKRNGGISKTPGESFLDAAKRLGAVGCIKGSPRGMSTNPEYLEGLGED
jgi:hypothetical protein